VAFQFVRQLRAIGSALYHDRVAFSIFPLAFAAGGEVYRVMSTTSGTVDAAGLTEVQR
jgi:hypothetical protein